MKTLAIIAALAAATAATPALAAFTLSNSEGGDGFVVVNSPTVFTLYGNNDGIGNNVASYGDVATTAATISGKWRYYTLDVDGSTFDPAGFFINSVFTQLSTSSIPRPAFQTGTFSFSVNPGDSFGFYVQSTDGALGRGVLTIGAVPEPESWAMLIAGFGLVGGMARRRRAIVAA
jgi:hypothetical protein